MKYILFQDRATGFRVPILFSERIIHAEMDRPGRVAIGNSTGLMVKPVSAGFIHLGQDFRVHGNSESMGLVSHPADEAFIGLGDSGALLDVDYARALWERAKKS